MNVRTLSRAVGYLMIIVGVVAFYWLIGVWVFAHPRILLLLASGVIAGTGFALLSDD